jgi:hypothetical protein
MALKASDSAKSFLKLLGSWCQRPLSLLADFSIGAAQGGDQRQHISLFGRH